MASKLNVVMSLLLKLPDTLICTGCTPPSLIIFGMDMVDVHAPANQTKPQEIYQRFAHGKGSVLGETVVKQSHYIESDLASGRLLHAWCKLWEYKSCSVSWVYRWVIWRKRTWAPPATAVCSMTLDDACSQAAREHRKRHINRHESRMSRIAVSLRLDRIAIGFDR